MKRAIVSVINDLATDQRVHRHCLTLQDKGYDVVLIGRVHHGSATLAERSYTMYRMWLLVDKGPLFYAWFNIALFFQLLFRRGDVYFTNDLDTLLPNFIVSKLKRKPLIYDSHEYFTQVPELVDRPRIQAIWATLEKAIVPRLKHAFTVSAAIAEAYQRQYGVKFQVLRNLPLLQEFKEVQPVQPPVILYQGAVNVGRGVDLAIRAMAFVDHAVLHIAGTGDVIEEMKQLSRDLKLENRVVFLGRIPFEKLAGFTQRASIGISIEESLGLNYQYALPNKLFDYIHAQVPVLVANLPAMAEVVTEYGVGQILVSREPEQVAAQLVAMLDADKQHEWRANCRTAALHLNWQKEVTVLEHLLESFHE